jgi:hypothetical protein
MSSSVLVSTVGVPLVPLAGFCSVATPLLATSCRARPPTGS